MAGPLVGSVALLRRFPVKSMLGEQPGSLEFDERGVTGDRLWAVRYEGGKYGAGKNTPRFRTTGGLRNFSASYAGHTPSIVFPNGKRWFGDAPGIHAALSQELGRPVTLAREDSVSLLDAGPGIVHVLTTAAVEYARKLLPDSVVDERRFRPNVLIRVPDAPGPVEDEWVGKTLLIGSVRLSVVERTERCVMVNHDREGLPYDGRVLKTLMAATGMRFGIYAEVVGPGTVRIGDDARLVG
jgi:uncharacterized protein YcbX